LVERCRVDASAPGAVLDIAKGAAAIYNCANPAYHRWEQDWPPIATALLDAAVRTEATLVTMSNLYVYGPVTGPIHPGLPLTPEGRKGRVRAAMWRDALVAHESGRVRVTEARGSDFFGPGLTHQSQLGERTLPRLLAGKSVRFLGDPNLPHSLTYVPDVGRTLAALGCDERALGRAWHVPSITHASYADAVRRLAVLADVVTPTIGSLPPALLRVAGLFSPTVRELHEVRYQFEAPFVIDAAETTETFGVTATPFDDALEATLAGWRARGVRGDQPKNSPPLTSRV
jgi:nucleoside-diphosphate-sugar epimerase